MTRIYKIHMSEILEQEIAEVLTPYLQIQDKEELREKFIYVVNQICNKWKKESKLDSFELELFSADKDFTNEGISYSTINIYFNKDQDEYRSSISIIEN